MIIRDKEFKSYNEKVSNSEVDLVNYKVLLRVEVRKQMSIDYLKSLIRGLFFESNIPIRYRVDIGEDSWLDKKEILGETLVLVRIKDKLPKLIETLTETLTSLGLSETLKIKGSEICKVDEFRVLTEKYDRALYGVKVDIKDDIIYSVSETTYAWEQEQRNWDGSISEKRIEGVVRVKADKLPSKSQVYKLLLDVPYGIDVYRVIESHFNLKKGSLKGYPIHGVRLYQSVDPRKNYLNRKKCSDYGDVIEMTVGGLVGDKCIRGLMGFSEDSI